MKPVHFHAEAEAELRSAIAFYETERQGLGTEFRSEIEAALLRFRRNPRAFPLHGVDLLRKCYVHRFPFTVYVLDLDEICWVAAVAHHKRKPDYWRSRRPG